MDQTTRLALACLAIAYPWQSSSEDKPPSNNPIGVVSNTTSPLCDCAPWLMGLLGVGFLHLQYDGAV